MININPDSVLFTCAVRYAIGRKSYMPELIWQELVLIIDRLSDRNLHVMKRDIESELKFDTPEKELWESLLEDINDEMQKRAAQKQKSLFRKININYNPPAVAMLLLNNTCGEKGGKKCEPTT